MDNYSNPNAPVQEQETLTFKDIWNLCLSHWKWFAISLGVCLFVAAFYILKTTPVYTRAASVLIKEDRKGGSVSGDISAAFSDLGFGQTRVNVNNEIINFLSPDLMLEVVKNLHLDVDYHRKGLFHDWTLYGTSLPVAVQFQDLRANDAVGLTVSPADSGSVRLSDFVRMGRKGKEKLQAGPVVAALGDTVATPLGNVVVTDSPYPDTPAFNFPIRVTRSGFLAASRRFRSKLSATLNGKNSTVIDLSVSDVNTQRAEDLLNMVVNVYNEIWIKDKNQITTSTNEFIAERLHVIESELGHVDKSITSYMSEHQLADIGAAATLDMRLSAEAEQQVMALNNQLAIARALQSDVRNAHSNTLLPGNVGLDDPSTAAQITQFNTLMLQRNRVAENSTEENLLVKDYDQQLDALRSAILTALDNYIKGLNIQIRATQGAQNKAQARVSSNPLQAGQLLSDERQQKVKEALYLFLLQKREENELSQAFTAYNTRVVASPSGSNIPFAPNKKMILLIALLLGLAIPFAILYLKEILNTTLRGRKDLENLSVPFLGELPNTGKKRNFLNFKSLRGLEKLSENPEERKIVVKPHSRNVINEAFRVVRTNLEFMRGKEGGAKVLMVTSMNVGSGKTFSTVNLATALAVKGRRVIVVDLDLRKRSMSHFAGQPKRGVADYLAGTLPAWKDAVVSGIGGNGLDMLPVGTMPPNPAELLAEPRLAQMLEEMRPEYDYIFLDCPPVEIVTDADIIGSNVDMTIFVVRAGLLERSMLPEIDRYYKTQKYKNMALLLNGTDGSGRYGYKYGYKYGYRYGSNGAYGSDGKEDE